MKGWFGPRVGTNAGYSGVWNSYDVMPVSREGWLATFVYGAIQIGLVWLIVALHPVFGNVMAWFGIGVPLLHLYYLWFASRHFVTPDETDQTVLPADMRR
jgi:hypothetical protein